MKRISKLSVAETGIRICTALSAGGKAMTGVLILLLTILSLTFLGPSQNVAQENERPPACAQWDKVQIPAADLPTPQERQALASCNSEDLYFGFDQPSDPVQARKCAYLERESGDAPIFGGAGILTMIYANGKGAVRNLDLALKFACEVNDPLQNTNGRVERLLELREAHWTGDNFSLCDVEGPSFWMGVCDQLAEQFAQVARARKVEGMVERWTPAQKAAFVELQKAANNFTEASSCNEVDTTGTGRASFVVQWEAWLRDGFVAAVERSEQGQLPSFSPAEFKKADEELNESYSKIQSAEPHAEGMGTVTPDGVRTAERAWLRYREAWVKFGLVKYPTVKPESWRSWLSYDRILMLHCLPGPQTPDWKAFQEYLPWRYQYYLGHYREAIRLKPDWAPPHNALGEDLAAKGDWDGAIKEYREAIRLDPNNADAHHNLDFAFEKKKDFGDALANKKDWDGAVKEYGEAVRLKPDDPGAHSYLGWALGNKKDWDGAVKEYGEAVRLKPNDAQGHYNLSFAFRNQGDWDGAVRECREAVRLKPDEPDWHGALGWALENKKDLDGAIKEYREAIRLNPSWAEARSNLCYGLYLKGDVDAAIAECREAIRLKPDYAQAHVNLAVALDKKGDWDGAIREYRETHRLEPSPGGLHYNVGQVLEHKGDKQAALDEYRQATEAEPKNSKYRAAYERLVGKSKD